MGKQLIRLESALKSLFATKQDIPVKIGGKLGVYKDGRKYVRVPNRPGYVYVRLGGNVSEAVEAVNISVPNQFDTKVIVTVSETNPGMYVVMGRDLGQFETFPDGGSDFVTTHGSSHSFGNGTDPVFIYRRQMVQPLLPRPTNPNSMRIYVEPDFFYWNGEFQYWGGGNSPILNPAKPTDGGNARYVTIFLEGNTNTIQVMTGIEYPIFPFEATGTLYYIPEVPVNQGIPLAAVILTTGTSSVGWNDIKDMRMFLLGGSNVSLPSFVTGSVPYSAANGSLTQANSNLFFDATNKRLVVGTSNVTPYSTFLANIQTIRNDENAAGFLASSFFTGSVSPAFITFFTSKGTLTSPTPVLSGTNIGRINATAQIRSGYAAGSGIASTPPISIEFRTSNDWVPGSFGSIISFQVTLTGSSTKAEAFRINPDSVDIVGKKFRLDGDIRIQPTGAISGQVLTFDGTRWIPTGSTGGSVGIMSGGVPHNIISSLHADTDITSVPAENSILVYHTGKWAAEQPTDISSDLADIRSINFTIVTGATIPASGHIQFYVKTGGFFGLNSSGQEIGPFLTGIASYLTGFTIANGTYVTGTHLHKQYRASVISGTTAIYMSGIITQIEFISYNGFIFDPIGYTLASGSTYCTFVNPLNTNGILTINFIV